MAKYYVENELEIGSNMLISAVAAMAENRTIGKNNQLLWHLPADFKHFKTKTTGHPIIMGRHTYESIGKPLPHRANIVITRDQSFKAEGCFVFSSLPDAIQCATSFATQEIFIIGGGQIYQLALPYIHRIYLTLVHHSFDGDTFFPLLNANEWREIKRESYQADLHHRYAYSFLTLERINMAH